LVQGLLEIGFQDIEKLEQFPHNAEVPIGHLVDVELRSFSQAVREGMNGWRWLLVSHLGGK